MNIPFTSDHVNLKFEDPFRDQLLMEGVWRQKDQLLR